MTSESTKRASGDREAYLWESGLVKSGSCGVFNGSRSSATIAVSDRTIPIGTSHGFTPTRVRRYHEVISWRVNREREVRAILCIITKRNQHSPISLLRTTSDERDPAFHESRIEISRFIWQRHWDYVGRTHKGLHTPFLLRGSIKMQVFSKGNEGRISPYRCTIPHPGVDQLHEPCDSYISVSCEL